MKLFVPFFVTLLALPFNGCAMVTSNLEEFINADGIYKIVTPENFNEKNKDKCINITSLDIKDGLIHASKNLEQIQYVLQKFFTQSTKVTIVALDKTSLEKAGFEVKEEKGFPHIYDSTKAFHIPFNTVKKIFYLIKEKNIWQIDNAIIRN